MSGNLASLLVCSLLLALGVRILLQAGRGGALPDRLVGLFFLCLGLGALPALSVQSLFVSVSTLSTARAVGHAILSVGYGALAIFIWRCFGPESAWRRAAALVECTALVGLWIVCTATVGFERGGAIQITAVCRGLSLAWAFGESLRYRLQLRRRAALGIGDPIVTNRFTLWCIWTGSLLCTSMIAVSVRFLVSDFASAPILIRSSVTLGSVTLAAISAISLGLSFFPPRFYRSWLGGEAAVHRS